MTMTMTHGDRRVRVMTSARSHRRRLFGLMLLPVLFLLTGCFTAPSNLRVIGFQGGAFGIESNAVVAGAAANVARTPEVNLVPDLNGRMTRTMASVTAPGVLAANTLTVTTEGTGFGTPNGRVESSATVESLTALGQISATGIRSFCSAHFLGTDGGTTLASVTLPPGLPPVGLTPPPNTTITVPGVATLILNEQIETRAGNRVSITVNAIRIIPLGAGSGGSITVAQSRCSVLIW